MLRLASRSLSICLAILLILNLNRRPALGSPATLGEGAVTECSGRHIVRHRMLGSLGTLHAAEPTTQPGAFHCCRTCPNALSTLSAHRLPNVFVERSPRRRKPTVGYVRKCMPQKSQGSGSPDLSRALRGISPIDQS